eukprot:61721-Pelagomonas_calceolata.AAC.8
MTQTGLRAYNMKFLKEYGATEAVDSMPTDRAHISFLKHLAYGGRDLHLCIKTHTRGLQGVCNGGLQPETLADGS